MEVLLLMPLGEQRGGGELMLLDLLRNSDETDISWRLMLFEEGPIAAEAERLGVPTAVVHAGRLRHLHRYLWTVIKVARAARDADLVLSWMPKAHLYGSPGAVLARRSAIWFQLMVSQRGSWMDVVATALPASGVLTLSKKAQKAQGKMRPRRRTALVYPGVDLTRFDPASVPTKEAARRTLGLPAERTIIGMAARLQRWKGVHLLIESLVQLRSRFPEAMAVVVGGAHSLEPRYESELHELAKKLGLGNEVVFAGLQRNVPLWLSAMDVVVHPAYDEPFGIAVVEAMAMGKPVVASDSGGPLEIIDNGENGVLFRTGDAIALAAALESLLSAPQVAAEIARHAAQRARDFSSQRYARELANAVKELARS